MTCKLRDDQLQRVEVAEAGGPYARMVADSLVEYAGRVLAERGFFALVLTGGRTPRPVYEYLAASCRSRIDWSRIAFFWGDERPVPADHADSNFRLARESLLSSLPISPANVHRMEAERPDLDAAALDYEHQIRDALRPEGKAIPAFDLVLLGMGDDGHTASLFPGTRALSERDRWVVANDVPSLQTRRMTFTFPLINAARAVWFLVTGAAKSSLLAEVFAPETSIRYPCQQVHLANRPVRWYLDDPAAEKVSGTFFGPNERAVGPLRTDGGSSTQPDRLG